MAKTKYNNVYVDSNGDFFYEVSLGVDSITGKRIKKKSKYNEYGQKFSSAKEASSQAMKLSSEYKKRGNYNNYNISFNDFVRKYYLPYYKVKVKPQTYESKKPIFNSLLSRFGNKKLRDISKLDINNYKIWLLSPDEMNYSNGYAASHLNVLGQILEYAKNLIVIDFNVYEDIERIRKEKTQVSYWTRDEFEKVISKIFIDEYYQYFCFVLLWTYYMTGMRVNEGAAITWSDLDFENCTLRINKTIVNASKNNIIIQNHTKTDSGNRVISLDSDTIKVLKNWKIKQSEYIDSELILSHDGFPIHRSTVSRIINRYAKLAGVHKIQAKGLRHSHASYLINEINAHILVVSQRLGHSSPEITLKYYAHLYSGLDEETASQMSGRVNMETSKKSNILFNGNQHTLL